jgi:transcriptional regulator with XRE-family HTH domain
MLPGAAGVPLRRRNNHVTLGKSLGENLREYRKKAGLSQRILGERASVKQADISDVERGKKTNLESNTLRRLAAALKITLAQLVEEDAGHGQRGSLYTQPACKPVYV